MRLVVGENVIGESVGEPLGLAGESVGATVGEHVMSAGSPNVSVL